MRVIASAAAAPAGGPTTVDLGADGTVVLSASVLNEGSSTLGTTSSIVLDSGNPGRPDAAVDSDYIHFVITDSIDWETCLAVRISVKWTAAPDLAYAVYAGISDATTLAANTGLYGGGVIDTGRPGGAQIGANPTTNATGAAMNAGGGIAVWCCPEENGATRFAQMGITSWPADFSDTGFLHRNNDPGATADIAQGGTLYGFLTFGGTASLAGGTFSGVVVTYEIIDR